MALSVLREQKGGKGAFQAVSAFLRLELWLQFAENFPSFSQWSQRPLDLSCACVLTAMRDGERRESLEQTGRGDLCRLKLRRRSLDRDCMQALSRARSLTAATDRELSIVALGIGWVAHDAFSFLLILEALYLKSAISFASWLQDLSPSLK